MAPSERPAADLKEETLEADERKEKATRGAGYWEYPEWQQEE